ncbi:TDT family transporter [Shewanella inventionis]|uniref:C4-dicarboxylate ABC transporter n=1 Tax=Shewanella inventionis TaxID=1738770 RepID=A0ABQ1IZR2_9GAMM|nr:TDT family transporter [Shewanella inventionis]MCL1157083.1 TDT family transporter [Shewanella inventionis]GGB55081.1 C4-dicarboxylate ABC transporter [Shewanella inventionis]
MVNRVKRKIVGVPTPVAGLALGIASLGWSWENAVDLQHYGQWISAAIASVLLLILASKFVLHHDLLRQDVAHPVVGSVVPTFAMALMVVSNSLGYASAMAGDLLWCFAVILHIIFLVGFIYHRSKQFSLCQMIPSWFIPPIGIVVADVSFSGNAHLLWIADSALIFGMLSYAVMLPMMIYRLIFTEQIPDAAKPTLAVLAAPASLSLACYLTISSQPSPVIIGLLFGIGVLMTSIIYLSFFKLMRLPFSPGYAAFTFPMVIGATALFKVAAWMQSMDVGAEYIAQVRGLAEFELVVATVVVSYVCMRYLHFYQPRKLVSA